MRYVLGTLCVFYASDALAIKVIGRGAPAPEPVKPTAKATKPAAPKKPAGTKAAKATTTDTLTTGQVCALAQPLKAKVYKATKTLGAGSQVTIRTLLKKDALLLTAQGDARVARAALAAVCSEPPPPPAKPEPEPVALVPIEPPKPAEPALVPAPPPEPVRVDKPVAVKDPVVTQADPFANQYDDEAYRKAKSMRIAAWTLTAVGVAGLAAGGTLFALNRGRASAVANDTVAYNEGTVRTQSRFDELTQQQNAVRNMDIISAAVGGVGLASLVTGIVLFAAGESPSKLEPKTSTSVTFVPGLGGFQLSGTF